MIAIKWVTRVIMTGCLATEGTQPSCADDLSVRAEQDTDVGLVTKSNAMRKSEQEKATQLSDVQSDLDSMLKVLKGL